MDNSPSVFKLNMMRILSFSSPKYIFFCLLTMVVLCAGFTKSAALKDKRTFYIDAVAGNDAHDGLASKKAWKTLNKINETTFKPGDRILFKCAQSWNGQLHPKGSGKRQQPIIVGSFGSGKKPLIAGNGVANGTIYLYNQQYWEFTGLEITNYNSAEEGGLTLKDWEEGNTANYAMPTLPPQLANSNAPKYGIYVVGKDAGELAHIYIKNMEIHGVNGYIKQADETSKENGGMFFKIIGTEKPTYFNGILIESCTIRDVDRTGILLCSSTWSQRTFTQNTNWTPSLNIVIRNNKFSNTGANALVVRVAKNPLIERNLFDHCAIKASGNAAFSFNSDGTLWQYNECRFTKANIADRDAGGIDSDYKTKNTVLQYNYVHDNDYGMLITGGPNNFNDSTIVRYNIFENDGKFAHPSHKKCVIRVSGSATNTHIYNNVIYLGKDQSDTKIVSHEVWKTSPDRTLYENNIFYNLGTGTFCDYEKSTNNAFNNNLYFGNPIANLLPDANAIQANPMFKLSESGSGKYRITKASPAWEAGKLIANNGGLDYFGNSVNATGKPHVGIFNGTNK